MYVRLFANKNHYVFGSNLIMIKEIVQEGKMVVKKQQGLLQQVLILIGQMVTFNQNAIYDFMEKLYLKEIMLNA